MSELSSTTTYTLPGEHEIPARIVPWCLDPMRTTLLVHDMQRYFLAPLSPSVRDPLVRNCQTLLTRCEALGVPVLYTAQPGGMTDTQRGLLKDIWGPGMQAIPSHREIVDELTPGSKSNILTKWRYSAFHGSGLLDLMREMGRDQLIICGVYAHVGILATAIEAFSNDIQPFLVANAMGDFSSEHHRMAIDYAAARCGVVLTTEEVFQ
jgi:trans-2,3-dihydro-3-hydroxyanthranilic acid synthase